MVFSYGSIIYKIYGCKHTKFGAFGWVSLEMTRCVGMTKKYWSVTEVVEFFQVNETFLNDLEKEDIVCPSRRDGLLDKSFSVGEREKVRLAKILMDEMDVNLAGVEVVLQMRKSMIAMRKQFDAILEDLAREMEKNLKPIS
jgi:MerR family transcriptional regulator, heat shock protein HspR